MNVFRSNNKSLQYERFTSSGCKDVEIRKYWSFLLYISSATKCKMKGHYTTWRPKYQLTSCLYALSFQAIIETSRGSDPQKKSTFMLIKKYIYNRNRKFVNIAHYIL